MSKRAEKEHSKKNRKRKASESDGSCSYLTNSGTVRSHWSKQRACHTSCYILLSLFEDLLSKVAEKREDKC